MRPSSSRQTNPNNKAPQGPRRPRLSSFRCNCQIAHRGRSPGARRSRSRRMRRHPSRRARSRSDWPWENVRTAPPPHLSWEESLKSSPENRGASLPLERGCAVGVRRYREALATCQTLFQKSRVRAFTRAQMTRRRNVVTATPRTPSAAAAARGARPCDRRRATCRRGAKRSG